MIQPTKALRKIAALKKRIWGIQGGQGAGKTFSIILLIINHALKHPSKEIYIVSSELSKMRDTVLKDFVKIIDLLGVNCQMTGVLYGSPRCDFPNKTFVRFLGLDKDDVGKGLRSDIVFINEANKINFEAYRELTSRAKRVIIDFNPNNKFWFHSEVQTREDCDFLNLTFLDNEYLSDTERTEILLYKSKGYKLDDNGDYVLNEAGNPIVINQYYANKWRIYGLGEIGQVEGRIYNWNKISNAEYDKIKATAYHYSDWGKLDPWAMGEVKYYDGCLYVHELNYESENEIERRLSPQEIKMIKSGDGDDYEGMISWKFTKCNIKKDSVIVCDSNRPNKIKSLRRSGWEYAIGVGGKLDMENRVSMLSALTIYYTETSKNIEMEQENYCYDDKGRPIDAYNHHIDGLVYVTQHLFNEGVINSL